MDDFKGKNGFITGAASGIGRSFALALAKKGMNLFITDINMEGLENVQNEVEKEGVNVIASKCDVSIYEDFEKAANDFFDKMGDVDLLINNAGIAIGGRIDDINLDDWKKVMDVNLWSVIHSIKAFLPRMMKRRSGHIVNIASGAGIIGSPEPLPYIASKFAVVGLSETFYGRLKNLGINVSVVVPAIIITDIWKPVLSNIEYPPKLLKDFGKEKLDEVYRTMSDEILKMGISPDVAVERYLSGIEKNYLYVFDNEEYYKALTAKGTEPREYEKALVEMQENRIKGSSDHFHKHGINIEDYM